MKRRALILLLVFSALILASFIRKTDLHKKFDTQQLIVVTTADWDITKGKLTAYEWKRNKWKTVLKDIPVVTGRSGLAWGKGLQNYTPNSGKQKKEGDGNSPAGIFYLSGLFGYGDMTAAMDYLKVDTRTFCVDDVNSQYYNKVVKDDTVRKDWNSAETMLMKSNAYKYGIFVDYNVSPAEKGNGSCIFMHIWDNANGTTAGCTAMTEENILNLIRFLQKDKKPVLVQVPEKEYQELKSEYKLP